ncbi:hypothetical protein D0962_28485 [Leptolyngbyaceae cyanobacterium CCMR0082]|uniref:Uncharacterized protein n=1 Tax=Adonisia turfae CCMR0082 TaxID=2304604 RepID=A0A6M0SF84_9CYAN|nr:hypothetical protein [Adonisia turfae]NEZ66651.1 hypothetical protein [Adonisia turfae CCMR0082]
MLLKYNPRKTQPASQGVRYFDGVPVHPGINYDLSESQVETIKAHPSLSRYEEWGAIEWVKGGGEVEAKPEAKSEADRLARLGALDDLTVDEAEKIVDVGHDVELLQAWANRDKRVTLRNAINQRITQIQEGRA